MGKKTLPRRRHRNRRPDDGAQRVEEDDDTNLPPKVPALLRTLRHADAPTKIAALSALTNHPDYFHNNKNHHDHFIDIGRAVLECILCPDEDVVLAATQALDQLLGTIFPGRPNSNNNHTNSKLGDYKVEDNAWAMATAGWWTVIAQKLQQWCNTYENSTNVPSLRILEQCTALFTQILEQNPYAMHRLQTYASQRDQCWYLLTRILQITMMRTNHTTANLPNPDCWSSASAWAARGLHSIADDNRKLVRELSSSSSSPSSESNKKTETSIESTLEALAQGMLWNGKPTPDGDHMIAVSINDVGDSIHENRVMQLHCVGAWLAISKSIGTRTFSNEISSTGNDESPMSWLDAQIPRCCEILAHTWGDWIRDHQQHVEELHRLRNLYDAYNTEREDQKLEDTVVRAVRQRKEPARQIARRLYGSIHRNLKSNKMDDDDAEEKHDDDANDDDDKDVSMDVTDDKKSEHKATLREDREDHIAAWENALHEWETQSIRPIRLALEIFANLTCTDRCGEGDEDDDMVMKDNEATRFLPEQLSSLILQYDLPNRLYQLFPLFLTYCTVHTNGNHLNLPYPIRDIFTDLQSKLAVGMHHCLAHIQAWTPAPVVNPNHQFWWQDWIEWIRADVQQEESPKTVLASTTNSCSSTLSSLYWVAVQSRPEQSWGGAVAMESLLEIFIQIIRGNQHKRPSGKVSFPIVQRDLVAILGRFASMSKTHRSRVCQGVLLPLGAIDTCDTMVLAEILNVLMDMYGDDDDDDMDDASFHSLRVMNHFEGALAVLKQRVSNREQTSGFVNDMVDDENEYIEQWKEIAWNCERFVQYKKEYGMKNS